MPRPIGAKYIALRRRLIKALHDGGVGLAARVGCAADVERAGLLDTSRARDLRRAGLTPYQALATGTRNVAVYFNTARPNRDGRGWQDALTSFCSTRTRCRTSPTRSRIAGVMVNGRWLSKADIDQRLAEGS